MKKFFTSVIILCGYILFVSAYAPGNVLNPKKERICVYNMNISIPLRYEIRTHNYGGEFYPMCHTYLKFLPPGGTSDIIEDDYFKGVPLHLFNQGSVTSINPIYPSFYTLNSLQELYQFGKTQKFYQVKFSGGTNTSGYLGYKFNELETTSYQEVYNSNGNLIGKIDEKTGEYFVVGEYPNITGSALLYLSDGTTIIIVS